MTSSAKGRSEPPCFPPVDLCNAKTHTDTQTHAHTHTHTHKDRHTDTDTQTHTGTDTQTHTQTHTDTHRHTQTHRHTHTHTDTQTHAHRHTHRHTHTHAHTDTRTHRHTHTHRHTDTHTQTHTRRHALSLQRVAGWRSPLENDCTAAISEANACGRLAVSHIHFKRAHICLQGQDGRICGLKSHRQLNVTGEVHPRCAKRPGTANGQWRSKVKRCRTKGAGEAVVGVGGLEV